MKMENWDMFVRSKATQVEWSYHRDWWITWRFLGNGNDLFITWVELQCTGLICPHHKMLVWNFGKMQCGFWCHYYVPVCAQRLRRQGCQRKCEERLVRETAHTSRATKSNTQTLWVHTRSNIVSMLRETESNLQAWNSDPNASGSRTWPKEKIDQSIDLRVDGISNDETYKDEQYMQRIAEQVQKLVTTKEIIKIRLIKGRYSQWTGREENSWSRQLWVTGNSAKN